jgi:predicted CXXCH cytochrome family protein
VHQAALDNCGNCHQLGSERSLELRYTGDRLCLGCHSRPDGAVAHGTAPCLGCHDPHSGQGPALVRTGGNSLCARCHSSRAVGQLGRAHTQIGAGASCVECHSAHRPQLREEEVCVKCHGLQERTAKDHADRSCGTCHWMHREAELGAYKSPAESCGTCHVLPEEAAHADLTRECAACHGFHEVSTAVSSGPRRCAVCHPGITSSTARHGDFALKNCAACHSNHDPRDLNRTRAACGSCHAIRDAASRHPKLPDGPADCLACHRTHPDPKLAALGPREHAKGVACDACHEEEVTGKGQGAPQPSVSLCLRCHIILAPSMTHGPARDGTCEACHAAHDTGNPSHLSAPETALCTRCHPDALLAGRKHSERLACRDCHNPHGGSAASYLRATAADLCLSCHKDPRTGPMGTARSFVHGPLNAGGCTICHSPHGSNNPAQLADSAGRLCRSCHTEHDRSATGNGGQTHALAIPGGCVYCHDPHAGEDPRLLRAPTEALCVHCHKPSEHDHTLQARNRGYTNVPEDWPREGRRLACRGCHLPHSAGGQQNLLVQGSSELCDRCHNA